MRAFAFLVTSLAMLAAVLYVAAGAMLSWEVAARYFFTRPTIWAAELSQLCLIWGTLMAMPWCLRERRHIRITALTGLMREGGQRLAEAGAMITVACFAVMVTWKGWEIFWDSFSRGRTSGTMLDLPASVSEAAVPAGFALLAAQALIEALGALRGELRAEGAHGE